MFARLTSVSIALIAFTGAVAAYECTLQEACCLTSSIIHAPTGDQGSSCWKLMDKSAWCAGSYTRLCCNNFDIPTGVAYRCIPYWTPS